MKMQSTELIIGNFLLLLTSILYSVWWGTSFKPPGGYHGSRKGTILLLAMFGSGIGGTIVALIGATSVPERHFSVWLFLLVGILVYFILLIISRFLFNRRITPELIVLMGICFLMVVEGDALYSNGTFSITAIFILAIVLVMVFVLNLLCYMNYYVVSEHAAYTMGLVPLITNTVFIAAIDVLIILSWNGVI
jgi:hypothetical protein